MSIHGTRRNSEIRGILASAYGATDSCARKLCRGTERRSSCGVCASSIPEISAIRWIARGVELRLLRHERITRFLQSIVAPALAGRPSPPLVDIALSGLSASCRRPAGLGAKRRPSAPACTLGGIGGANGWRNSTIEGGIGRSSVHRTALGNLSITTHAPFSTRPARRNTIDSIVLPSPDFTRSLADRATGPRTRDRRRRSET